MKPPVALARDAHAVEAHVALRTRHVDDRALLRERSVDTLLGLRRRTAGGAPAILVLRARRPLTHRGQGRARRRGGRARGHRREEQIGRHRRGLRRRRGGRRAGGRVWRIRLGRALRRVAPPARHRDQRDETRREWAGFSPHVSSADRSRHDASTTSWQPASSRGRLRPSSASRPWSRPWPRRASSCS
jgi:hypothetical protein